MASGIEHTECSVGLLFNVGEETASWACFPLVEWGMENARSEWLSFVDWGT